MVNEKQFSFPSLKRVVKMCRQLCVKLHPHPMCWHICVCSDSLLRYVMVLEKRYIKLLDFFLSMYLVLAPQIFKYCFPGISCWGIWIIFKDIVFMRKKEKHLNFFGRKWDVSLKEICCNEGMHLYGLDPFPSLSLNLFNQKVFSWVQIYLHFIGDHMLQLASIYTTH